MKWIGNGVVSIKGKDYGYGDDLPKDVDKKSLKTWKEDGLVGNVIQTVVDDPKTAALEKQIEVLTAENEDLKAQIEELTDPKKDDKK